MGKRNHLWEVRHAGLLGVKYGVAGRSDLFDAPKSEGEHDVRKSILQGVVDAAVLGYILLFHIIWCIRSLAYSLGDRDDGVRAVAASHLLPISNHLIERLPEELGHVLAVLWNCLRDMKDGLSSNVGAAMDLLGKYAAHR